MPLKNAQRELLGSNYSFNNNNIKLDLSNKTNNWTWGNNNNVGNTTTINNEKDKEKKEDNTTLIILSFVILGVASFILGFQRKELF